jgi:hypothetical protein
MAIPGIPEPLLSTTGPVTVDPGMPASADCPGPGLIGGLDVAGAELEQAATVNPAASTTAANADARRLWTTKTKTLLW